MQQSKYPIGNYGVFFSAAQKLFCSFYDSSEGRWLVNCKLCKYFAVKLNTRGL